MHPSWVVSNLSPVTTAEPSSDLTGTTLTPVTISAACAYSCAELSGLIPSPHLSLLDALVTGMDIMYIMMKWKCKDPQIEKFARIKGKVHLRAPPEGHHLEPAGTCFVVFPRALTFLLSDQLGYLVPG